LTAEHDLSQFACGKPALDQWLKTRALSNQQRGFTVVMVIHDAGRVVGYYGLAPTAVTPQPPNAVPCLMLGQLATDREWTGRGIGTGLLRHALMRSVAGAHLVGGRALLVNALDEEAALLWRLHGFIASKDDPLILFRSLPDIAASLKKAGIKTPSE
jgi:GNAT superfamily N-acetyltransferase